MRGIVTPFVDETMNRILKTLTTGLTTGLLTGLGYLGWRRLRTRGGDGAAAAVVEEGEAEPVLGYDGMDPQTLIPWLESANLDRNTLQRVRTYEKAHRNRENVLGVLDDLLR
jgi:hypothetical protein